MPVGSLEVGSLYLMPLHLGWLVTLFIGSKAVVGPLRPKENVAWTITCGLVASQLVPEMMRTGKDGDSLSVLSAWKLTLILSVIGCTTSCILKSDRRARSLNSKMRVAVILTVIAVVLAYRISHACFLLLGVPNDARSFNIAGYEIHHITSSTVLLWPAIAWRQRSRFSAPFAAVICAILVASIADQYFYMLHIGHILQLDSFYGSTPSTIGAIVATSLICAILYASARRPLQEVTP